MAEKNSILKVWPLGRWILVEIRDRGHYRSPPRGKIIAAKEGGLIDKQLSNILQ